MGQGRNTRLWRCKNRYKNDYGSSCQGQPKSWLPTIAKLSRTETVLIVLPNLGPLSSGTKEICVNITWNGSRTNPRTCPQACILCLGQYEGEFVRLECGHGAQHNYPMHVTCAIRTFGINDPAHNKTPRGRCPVCRNDVSEDVLKHLVIYIRVNIPIVFPGEDGRLKQANICRTTEEQERFLSTLSGAIAAKPAPPEPGRSPRADEDAVTYWSRVMQELASETEAVQEVLNSTQCTREDLAEACAKMRDMEHDATDCIKQAEELQREGYVLGLQPDGMSYRDVITRLRNIEENLRHTHALLRQKEENLRRREEEHPSPHVADRYKQTTHL